MAVVIEAIHRRPFTNLVPAKMFAGWLIRASRGPGGQKYVCQQIKSLAFDYRVWSITAKKPNYSGDIPRAFRNWLSSLCCHAETRAQFARVARMLPVGNKLVIDQALRKHRSVVTRRPKLDIGLAHQIYGYARDYIHERKHSLSERVSFHPTEGTASRDVPASAGGRLRDLVDNAHRVMSQRPIVLSEYLYSHKKYFDDAIVEAAIYTDEKVSTYNVDVLAIPEPGFKARVLCKFPATALLAGDIIRRQLWPIFESDPNMDFDQDIRSEKFQNVIRRSLNRDGTIVSSDLSNATDYIPHEYAKALWAGILDAFDFPEWVENYLERMFAPIRMSYPDGVTVTSCRGIQMGTPLSFLTLSLLHKFCVHKSGHERSPYIIRGDDLLGVFSSPRQYLTVMEEIGFKINRDKTVISKDGGTFAEQTVKVTWKAKERDPLARPTLYDFIVTDQKVVSSITNLDDIPFKGLIHLDNKGGRLRQVGRWYAQWSPYYPPRKGKVAYRAIRRTIGNVLRIARSLRIPITCPMELGGCGIPNKRGTMQLDANFQHRSRVGYAASHESHNFQLAVRKLDIGNASDLLEDYRQHVADLPKGKSVYMFDPYSSEDFSGYRRKRMLLNNTGNYSAYHTKPVPLHRWLAVFSRCKENRARWVPSRRCSGSDLRRLIDRIKMLSPIYVPYTTPNAQILSIRI
ncbi:RNA-dependent RNA polymerase [Hubei narna-like virus 18]|uniref:RNA-dependent RNA polymerase n=1 Tax=Hubei narna-like virus 18 TaxID=1922948 RepID=UPI0009098062|nr:RNA-dependent RNA polymerase [Hubei narna-like virus 18]APG77102.1 RNA-dependent RNA polymerase [Hubei narna-like virus 18]